MKRTPLKNRILPDYTKGEEIFNFVSHTVGAAIGAAALVICVVLGAIHKDILTVVCGAIFGVSMIILYSISSIYHALSPRLTAKKVMQIIDHCSIFILIAGTYTPITLCCLRHTNATLAYIIFALVWSAAILGIVLNSIDLKNFKIFSAICYIIMGWCIVFASKPTAEAMGTLSVIYLISGGICYTIGALFYYFFKKKRYMHSVFHLFVLFGSILHTLCILNFIM